MPSPSKRVHLRGVPLKAAAGAGRKLSIIGYSGGLMDVPGFGTIAVDLAGMQIPATLPLLADHENRVACVVGSGHPQTDLRNLVVSGMVAPTTAGNEVLTLLESGTPLQASIGADPLEIRDIADGETVTVNSQQLTGPFRLIAKSVLREVTITPLGADPTTRVSLAAARAAGVTAMTFEEWIASMAALFGGKADAMDEAQTAAAKIIYQSIYPDSTAIDPPADSVMAADPAAMTDEEKKKAEEAAKQVAARAAMARILGSRNMNAADKLRAETADEMDRHAAIQALAAKYDNPMMEHGGKKVSVAAHAIRNKWTVDKAHLEMIDRDRPSGPHLHVPSGGPAITGEIGNRIIEAALCTSLGQKDVEKRFKEPELEAAHKAFRGRVGMSQVILMAAVQNGYHAAPGERINAGNIRDILGHAFPRIRAASTLSLPGILSNVANKESLTGYMEEDQSWREVSVVKSTNDFKTVTSYRLLDNMAYEQLGADGKIKHGTVSEESYTRAVNTYAKMFALTRRDIINDDMSALADIRNRLGRGAAQKFNDVFWTEFLNDHATFFTAARTNYITGATTTLLTDGVGLGLAVKAFRQMTSPSADGTKRIGGTPEILLVPPELEQAAEALFVNQNLGTVKTSDANIYANKYRVVVCPWLSDSAFAGYSTTAWYLLRNPSMMPMVVASFLNGMESPTVEDSDADFDTLGIQFRGYHEFGADQAEYLCGIKSKGAA